MLIVVIRGMVSSTLLDQIVTPALFWRFGHKVAEEQKRAEATEATESASVLRIAAQFDHGLM
ncbi:MAG: hypothetical protein JNG89_04985 [Planctomycetaceae bacterium]|nr:hypothetical protein [Planctomycetaceae bacterium]